MKVISDFSCTQEDEIVSWMFDGIRVVKTFDARVFAECFKEKDGVIVVIRSKVMSPNNAVVFNPDGSEKSTVVNPLVEEGDLGFSDIYYVKDNLVLISTGKLGQHSCIVDKEGKILSVSETR